MSKKLSTRQPEPQNSTPSKKQESGKTLTLNDVIFSNGLALQKHLISLSSAPGKYLRSAFLEPSDEDLSQILHKLRTGNTGSIRLIKLIKEGLQIGELPKANDGLWSCLRKIISDYLHSNELLKLPSSNNAELSCKSYERCWDNFKEAHLKNKPSIKKARSAQDLLILDALFAYCSEKLNDDDFLQAISLLDLPISLREHQQLSSSWSLTTIIATIQHSGAQIAASKAINDRLDHLKRNLHSEQLEKKNLSEQLNRAELELKETIEALEEESETLKQAELTIGKLQNDVKTVGSIYKYKLDDTRAKYKGLLEGDLNKQISTIQTCAEMTPPRSKVIIERVETILTTIKRELQWLKNSE